MKFKDYFKVGQYRQSKMPLTIAIGIPCGGIIGFIVFSMLRNDPDVGMTVGGILGLSIGLLVGAVIDVYEKRKK